MYSENVDCQTRTMKYLDDEKKFSVKETKSNSCAYSKILIDQNARIKIVSIGLNPRARSAKKKSPLEPTRKNTINAFKDNIGPQGPYALKSLVQLDLSPIRTATSAEFNCIMKYDCGNKSKDIETHENVECLEQEIKNGDYILLAWGAGVQWERLPKTKKLLIDVLKDPCSKEKLYWFGSNKSDNSPKHAASYGKHELRRMSQDDLSKIFGSSDKK